MALVTVDGIVSRQPPEASDLSKALSFSTQGEARVNGLIGLYPYLNILLMPLR